MAEKKKGILKKVLIVGLATVIAVGGGFAAWKLLKKDNGKNPVALSSPTGITVTYDQKTGHDVLAQWGVVANADGYQYAVKEGTKVIESGNVNTNEADLDESKLKKDGEYTVTITAIGSGDYKNSAPTTHSFSYTYDQENNLVPLVMSDVVFDKETQTLSWTPVEGALVSHNTYTISIYASDGKLVSFHVTSGTSLNISGLNLPTIANAGTAAVMVKGNQVTTSDSPARTIVIDNYREPVVDNKEERMQAYEEWETAFKTTVGTSLQVGTLASPIVDSIDAIEIKDSTTAGKSVVTVYATYGGINVGSISYEVDKITGAKYQDKLDDVNSKIQKSNIVTGSRSFMGNNVAAPSLIHDLSKNSQLPSGDFKTLAQYQGLTATPITEAVEPIVLGGGAKNYNISGLIELSGIYFNINYSIKNVNDLRTDAEVYADLATSTGSKVLGITENVCKQVDIWQYMEQKKEYEDWLIEQSSVKGMSMQVVDATVPKKMNVDLQK